MLQGLVSVMMYSFCFLKRKFYSIFICPPRFLKEYIQHTSDVAGHHDQFSSRGSSLQDRDPTTYFPLRRDELENTYIVLWSLPADGSRNGLRNDEAEIWSSFINPDAKPRGDKRAEKVKFQGG